MLARKRVNSCSMGDSIGIKIIKFVFFVTNVLAMMSGSVIILLAIFSVFRTPTLSCIAARLIVCGITLLTDGIFGTFFTSMCLCCKCCNAKCLTTTFSASFSVCLELAMFGGMYWFYVDNWQALVFLNGNQYSILRLDYDQAENIDDLWKSYMLPLKLSAVFCFLMFFVMFANSILSMIILGPLTFLKVCKNLFLIIYSILLILFCVCFCISYLKYLRPIAIQMVALCGSELIFIGSFFVVLSLMILLYFCYIY